MTLILTLARPGEGIWQTVDARLTKRGKPVDDFASKQLTVHRFDGTVILAYTGLAEVHPSGESMFDWIRGTLTGANRSIEGDLLHLQERLNRDVARSRYWREPLFITADGVLGTRTEPNSPLQTRRMVRWVLTNHIWPDFPAGKSKVVPSFQLGRDWVDAPQARAAGSGRHAVAQSQKEMERLIRSLTHRPNKPIDYLGLLAAVNRRAAPCSKGTVSPWCSGKFMPELGQNPQERSFSKHGDPEPPSPGGMSMILHGMDLTDFTRRFVLDLQKGLPPSSTIMPNTVPRP